GTVLVAPSFNSIVGRALKKLADLHGLLVGHWIGGAGAPRESDKRDPDHESFHGPTSEGRMGRRNGNVVSGGPSSEQSGAELVALGLLGGLGDEDGERAAAEGADAGHPFVLILPPAHFSMIGQIFFSTRRPYQPQRPGPPATRDSRFTTPPS